MEPLYVFEDNYGHKHYLIKEISRGGQGAVFRTTDKNIAVKICLNNNTPVLDDTQNLTFNKIRLMPFPETLNITLPRAILKGASGYVMELLENMDSFDDIFNTKKYTPVSNKWLKIIEKDNKECANDLGRYAASGGSRRRLELYLRFADLLTKLHCTGLVYCDVSSRNIFGSSDPKKSNVWLIDSDNVNYQEVTISGQNAFYTPGYGAPELIDQGIASMYSDSYAFTISFFWDLTMSHPFKGKRLDELCGEDFDNTAEDALYSGNEPWILDSEDDSNYGEPSIPAEFIFSKPMMDIFQRMFSKESRLEDSMARPTMPEITEEIAHLTDTTVQCAECGMQSVYHEKCPWCNAKQRTLKLVSHYNTQSGKKRTLWTFIREFPENCKINIPYRIISGLISDSIDKTAFSIASQSDGIAITDFSFDLNASVKENNSEYKRIFGSYRTKEDSFVIIIENDSTTGVIIEGSVIN